MRTRTIVSAIIYNDAGQLLICKTPNDLGVYPGQWALPGSGIEPDETLWEALSREVREEVSLEITQAEPWLFQDDSLEKLRQDGSHELTYMIFLRSIAKQEIRMYVLTRNLRSSLGLNLINFVSMI